MRKKNASVERNGHNGRVLGEQSGGNSHPVTCCDCADRIAVALQGMIPSVRNAFQRQKHVHLSSRLLFSAQSRSSRSSS